jgi:hypothetical protein
MAGYRLSKYNPALRDSNGAYTRLEWTSISDIGRTFDGVVVGLQDYMSIEDRYVRAISDIHHAAGCGGLVVRDLESFGDDDPIVAPEKPRVRDGAVIHHDALEAVVRACLREEIWCRLEAEDGAFMLHFGYDYYVYITTEAEIDNAIDRARSAGLFVEAHLSPYLQVE